MKHCRAGYMRFQITAAIAIALGACGGGDGSSNENSATLPPPDQRTLPAEWYADADNNAIPDFLERQIGFNPTDDDCPLQGSCGPGADGSPLNLRSNILLILDSSGSMAARMGGPRKIDHAKQALTSFIGGVPQAVKLGFMVYGHRGNNRPAGKAESCAGTELLAPIGSVEPAGVRTMLSRFEPRGWTPIARSLEAAKAAFQGRRGNRIILVSDGIETCEGDPVAVARQLKSEGFDVQVDVVGFDVSSADAAGLRRIAEAGGGSYFNARTRRELDQYLAEQNRAAAQSLGDSNCEWQRHNQAMLCDGRLQIAAMNALNQQAAQFRQKGDQAAVAELTGVRGRIMQYFRSRKAERQALRNRAEQLGNKGFGTVRQTISTLDQSRSAEGNTAQ